MLTRHTAGRVYNYEYCIGRDGRGGTAFRWPLDFAQGPSGSLYVINRGDDVMPNHGITKCTLDHELLWEQRGPGFGDGQSPWPNSLDVDSDENLYVSDDAANQVFIYDKDGGFLRSWGGTGSGDGELNGPSGLALDKGNNLYVVDSLNHRVQKFTKDGNFLNKWGSHGSAPGQFDMPWGIAIDQEGDVYVADWKNDRVQKFTSEGEFLATFGKPGTGDGELRGPTGVAIDAEGDVYVADWGNDRLNIYGPEGTFITAFSGDADRLSPWGQVIMDANPDYVAARRRVDLTPERRFRRPVAVNVNDDGRIMVLESQRHRIQIYVKERNFVDAQFNL